MTKRVRNEACQPEQIHNSRDARFIGDVLLSYARKDAVGRAGQAFSVIVGGRSGA